MYQRLFKEDHPDVARGLNNLGGLYSSQGRYSEAEPLYKDALEILIKTVGEDHPNTKTCRGNLIRFSKTVNELIESFMSQFQQSENSSE